MSVLCLSYSTDGFRYSGFFVTLQALLFKSLGNEPHRNDRKKIKQELTCFCRQ